MKRFFYRKRHRNSNISEQQFSQRSAIHSSLSTSGFTLIEVLVVVVITGVLAAIAAPHWQNFYTVQTLNTGRDQTFQVIRQAQTQAIQSHISWQASFREVGGVMQWATHPMTTSPAAATWQTMVSGVHIDTAETTIVPSNGVYAIQFTHNGQVNPPLRRLTLFHNSSSKIKRCVFVSTVLGVLRKAENQATPNGNRYCY